MARRPFGVVPPAPKGSERPRQRAPPQHPPQSNRRVPGKRSGWACLITTSDDIPTNRMTIYSSLSDA